MTGWEGPFPPRSRPRRVDGGIRARSTRGAIGQSWWSRRFIEVLESFALGSRLARGKSYARQGQVLRLTVAPGRVTASVQGSRARPYQVTVGLAPFPALVWARVELALAGQAYYSAHLLAGELPAEIEEVFAAAGAPLFPAAVRDLTMRCSCPDPVVPCKHLAATFYLLAEEFDADPFQILHWRGRDRGALLDRLRELRGAAPAPAGPVDSAAPAPAGRAGSAGHAGSAGPEERAGAVEEPPLGAAVALAGLDAAVWDSAAPAGSADRFWLAPVPLPERPPVLATEPDLLLRQLPPPGPAAGGADLVDWLHPAYQRFASAG